jgi:hypothetical protein
MAQPLNTLSRQWRFDDSTEPQTLLLINCKFPDNEIDKTSYKLVISSLIAKVSTNWASWWRVKGQKFTGDRLRHYVWKNNWILYVSSCRFINCQFRALHGTQFVFTVNLILYIKSKMDASITAHLVYSKQEPVLFREISPKDISLVPRSITMVCTYAPWVGPTLHKCVVTRGGVMSYVRQLIW